MSEESTALQKILKAKEAGALVFANIEHCEPDVELYRAEVTSLCFKRQDFHEISKKFMPNKAVTDRMGEASGIQFIQSACRVRAETRDDPLCGKRTVFCAEAQGKKRLPDGSWLESTVDEYEFDPTLRAMLDKNITELTEAARKNIGRAILEYMKVGRQRAATGARLRVIRQLTGMPPSFEADEIAKPMLFSRIVQNTQFILKTPEGRAMATAQALGWDSASIFGAKKPAIASNAETDVPDSGTDPVTYELVPNSNKNDTPEPENKNGAADLAAKAAADNGGGGIPFGDDDGNNQQPDNEFEKLTAALEEYTTGYKEHLDVTTSNGNNPYRMAMAELENKNATVESRRLMVEKVKNWLVAMKIPGAA
jgi:hypothetical protein